MPDYLYTKINEILEDRQLSISGITRELKTGGFNEHRLVLTGYLRALRDMKKINEIEIPPAKVYSRTETAEEPFGDIYSLINSHLRYLEPNIRVPVAVYMISALLKRPCFKHELTLVGLNQNHIKKCLETENSMVRESVDTDLKEYRSDVTRIKIPPSDPAYEITDNNEQFMQVASNVLFGILKDVVDTDGLIAKTKQTKLSI
ncbi:MAG: hypothetical protein MIO92_07880 [Methanosarcinaceae archaeon]|nr:hypothetical protein [Methanosarcinaceae archaeon]